MPPSLWHTGLLAGLDFETTGVDVETARIVQAALVHVGGNRPPRSRTWLVSPGVEIPAEATAVHGLTGAYLAEHGEDPQTAIRTIILALQETLDEGATLVGHNLGTYDLNVLDRECRRHLGLDLPTALARPIFPIIDTLVLDKHVLPYRKRVSETQGARQLRTAAEVYRVGWDEDRAHGAEYDALKAAQIAWVIGAIGSKSRRQRPDYVQAERSERFDDVMGLTLADLHARQVHWASDQAQSFEQYLRSPRAGAQQNPAAVIDGRWPLTPAPAGVAA
jgi:DNA polymerase-3 subunit epsilon